MPIEPQENAIEDEKRNTEGMAGVGLAGTPTKKKADGSLLLYTVIAIGIALAVRFFIAAPYLVDGPSMEETFHNHDYLIVDRFSYGLCLPSISTFNGSTHCMPVGDPQRGDVIVFNLPQKGTTLIKRIIGLPGDTVTVSETGVMIANTDNPKGFMLSEDYLSPADLGGVSGQTVTLAPGHYFVMGDNRKVSYDSRSWGTLSRSDIIGRVILRLYPLSKIGFFPGEARYQ